MAIASSTSLMLLSINKIYVMHVKNTCTDKNINNYHLDKVSSDKHCCS